jgi:hypothetical protein
VAENVFSTPRCGEKAHAGHPVFGLSLSLKRAAAKSTEKSLDSAKNHR